MRILFHDFKMPYLLKNLQFPIGGFTIRLKQIIQELSKYDNDVAVITWEGSNNFVEQAHDFKLLEAYSPEKGIKKIGWIYYKLPKLYKTVKIFNPDVIIQGCASINSGFFALISKILKIPFIYMAANDIDSDDRYKYRLNIQEQIGFRYGLKHCDGIICQNIYQYDQFKKQFPHKKIEIIRNPYQFSKAHNNNCNNKRNYIAWIGVFQKQKNLSTLFQLASSNKHYQFCIAGIEGKLDQETKDSLLKLKKLDNVQFIGYLGRDKILLFLSKAIALLNTSDYEGLPNTFLESLSVGTPILSINSNPNNMLSEHKLGYIIDVNNFENTVKKIQTKFDYNNSYPKFINYLKCYHDPKEIALQLNNFCSQIVNKKHH